ncbi:MAG: hypothetical protein WBA68_07730 [Alteraurantiacibacter sp.]
MLNNLPTIALMLSAPLLLGNGDPELPFDAPPTLKVEPQFVLDAEQSCTDTIRQVRAERGLPLLQRGLADPNAPIMFNAVDYDVDGCDVLVVNGEDIRPLPQVDDTMPLIQPAQ